MMRRDEFGVLLCLVFLPIVLTLSKKLRNCSVGCLQFQIDVRLREGLPRESKAIDTSSLKPRS